MNILSHWTPIRDINDLQNRVLHALGSAPAAAAKGKQAATADWVPVVDILESEQEYIVKAELPEVARENVRVTVDDGRLAISGERILEKQEDGLKYHRVERSYGKFLRSFNLPENADATQVSAEFKDGVLRVRLPKQEKPQPREIEVKVD